METNLIASHATELEQFTVLERQYPMFSDSRGFIPVFEYDINGNTILWDRDTRYVYLTGIWKALNHTKSDIIKTLQSNPVMKVNRIRGGILKIQGTWVPYEDARALCIRTAWSIRYKLVPLFGPTIIDDCLPPSHPNYRVICLDYLQRFPEYFKNNPLIGKKRRYVLKAPSVPPPHTPSPSPAPHTPSPPLAAHTPSPSPPPLHISSPPLPLFPIPFSSSSPSPHSSHVSPMALSHILNNDVVFDESEFAGPGGPFDFHVVPVYGPPPSLIGSPPITYFPKSYGIASFVYDWDEPSILEDDIADSIETIQATILLHGLSQQDRFTTRQTVPEKLTLNGREFAVHWN